MCDLLIKVGRFVTDWMILFKIQWIVKVKRRDVSYGMSKYTYVSPISWTKTEEAWLSSCKLTKKKRVANTVSDKIWSRNVFAGLR